MISDNSNLASLTDQNMLRTQPDMYNSRENFKTDNDSMPTDMGLPILRNVPSMPRKGKKSLVEIKY